MGGVSFFPSPVRECVNPPPPFPLSLWTLLRRLPSVRLSVSGPPFRLGVSAPNRLPPVGLRSTPPPLSVQLFQALPAFLRFCCLSSSLPRQPTPPVFFVFGLPVLLFLWTPHIFFVSLWNPHADHPYLSLTPTPHSSTIPFLLQAPPSLLFVSEDALFPSPHLSLLFWVIYLA